MSIRYLPHLDPERWYIIDTDYGSERGRPSWHERRVSLHGPNSEASVSWNLLGPWLGLGFQVGRNGGESDLGLNLYVGKLASVWLRLRAPWTRWARVSKEQDPEHWYYARHYGLRFWPFHGCLVRVECGARDGYSSSKDPWREMKVTGTTILGRVKAETIEGEGGVARIPLPEGVYVGTYQQKTYVRRYVRFPGTLIDAIRGPRRHTLVDVDVKGGIPVEGKGENSWDCGMDGIFSTSGPTVEDAVGNYVRAVLRDRASYGGPHDLDRPMTVNDAESRGAS